MGRRAEPHCGIRNAHPRLHDGQWLTGDQAVIDGAARGLLDFAAEIDIDRHGHPAALVVVTATGGGGKRTDGVHVVPITALGP